MLNFRVNQDRCIACGQCVNDCPARCIVMEKGELPKISDAKRCIRCQHCLAVCPTGAISILGVDPDASLPLDHELPPVHSMETLIKGRRSVRQYAQKSLDRGTINRLVETAWHAPTGTNSQGVLFTVTMTREITKSLGREIYARLGEMLPQLDPEADTLAHKYLRMAHTAYTKHENDVILRGAPHILIASAPGKVAVPQVDCVIALTNFELMAQTMGIGTVWDGMLTWALTEFFPDLAGRLGVPKAHTIGYCMAFGRPAVRYHRTVQRGPAKVNLVEAF